MTAGNLIREARERLGWTQTQLATRLGLTPSAITKVEKDELFLKDEKLNDLARWLVLDFDALQALVNEERTKRRSQRIRVQGEAMRRTFGSSEENEAPATGQRSTAEQLGREILDDPDLTRAFRCLRAVFADVELKAAILKLLEACAAQANTPRPDRGSGS
ncbi:MAG TPA: helix-turn-helix transcriptional regulator [Gemmataceae bacterium]|nr:helix-turn-helix transcriptional regulator [Gemmataceae bacterium]